MRRRHWTVGTFIAVTASVRFTFLSLNVAIAAAALVVACGSSTPTKPSPVTAAAVAAELPPVDVKVMTFNIQHGLNGAGKYGLQAAIDTIAKVNPDIVGLQELTRNHPSYNCEDQPALIAQGLSAATGHRWYAYYKNEWVTTVRDCMTSGRGDDVETEGIGFIAQDPIPAPRTTPLWNGRLGVMTTIPRAHDIPITVTHLAAGTTGQNQSDRLRQLDTLIPWTMSQSGMQGRLLICDCNSSPGSPEYQRIRGQYRDAWEDGVAAGLASGRVDGITHKSSRIDYVFYVGAANLQLKSIENVDTKTLIGQDASDHNPVVAVFTVR